MSEEDFTETENESWGVRLSGSLYSVFLGLILFVASVPLLVWNEGRTVKRYKTLDQGQKIVTSISIDKVDTMNEGKLVHFTGVANNTGNEINDDLFGITASDSIRYKRNVEMYQWRETSEKTSNKKLGGGKETVTTFSYAKDWTSTPIDSSTFKVKGGHENSAVFPFQATTITADSVHLGAFELGEDLLKEYFGWFVPLAASEFSTENVSQEATMGTKYNATKYSNGFYYGRSASSPTVNDTRVTFEIVPEQKISGLAGQIGDTFTPFVTKNGGTILIIKQGTISAIGLFTAAKNENKILAWILRAVGFLLMTFSFYLILEPLAVFADCIPCIGDLVEGASLIISFVLALVLSGIVIAVSWIAYRPLIAVPVLAVMVGILVFMQVRGKKAKEQRKLKNEDGDLKLDVEKNADE